jgi:hypothetical protein
MAYRPGGMLHSFSGGYEIKSTKAMVKRAGSAFLAAEGEHTQSLRTLLLSTLLLLRP